MAKRRSVLVVYVAQTGEMKEAYKILIENLAKLRVKKLCRCGDKIVVVFTSVGRGDVDWVYLYGYRVQRHACVNTVMSLGFRNRRGNSWTD